jgi:hypothetical protein
MGCAQVGIGKFGRRCIAAPNCQDQNKVGGVQHYPADFAMPERGENRTFLIPAGFFIGSEGKSRQIL